jgi:DivIVA domain-containing protein
VLTVLAILGVLAVLFVAAAVATREGPLLADAPPDLADVELPDGPLQPEDLRAVRFALAVRGYRMDEVDRVIDRAATELAQRDQRITELEGTTGRVPVAAAAEQAAEQVATAEPAADEPIVPVEPAAPIVPTEPPLETPPVRPEPQPPAQPVEPAEPAPAPTEPDDPTEPDEPAEPPAPAEPLTPAESDEPPAPDPELPPEPAAPAPASAEPDSVVAVTADAPAREPVASLLTDDEAPETTDVDPSEPPPPPPVKVAVVRTEIAPLPEAIPGVAGDAAASDPEPNEEPAR